MTPEELESRLMGLETPEPPQRVRDRLLHPPVPAPERWRAGTAVAASFVAAALIFWIVWRMAPVEVTPATQDSEAGRLIEKLGHDDPAERDKASARLIELGEAAEAAIQMAESHKDPEVASRAKQISRIFARAKRFGRITPDRQLQEKLGRILDANPGKAVLVSRVWDQRDGVLKPMTSAEWRMDLSMEEADEKYTLASGLPVDSEGYLFFLVPPGKIHINGYNSRYPTALREFYHAWEGYTGDHTVGEVLFLPEQKMVPRMRWTFPAAAESVSIKKNPDIAWEAYPGVTQVNITLTRHVRDGAFETSRDMAHVDRDCSKENRIPLAALLKSAREPLGAGSSVGLTIIGKGPDGKTVSGNISSLRFVLEE